MSAALSSAVVATFQEAAQVLKPPPKVTVTEWAEQYRHLSTETSSEGGRYRSSRAPYQRQMQDAILWPLVEEVVLWTAAQMTKSTVLENLFAYFACEDPCTLIWMWQSLDRAKEWSNNDLSALIRDTAPLASMLPPGVRNAGNQTLFKKFPGGALNIIGANSPGGLRAKRARIVLCDEVDAYPASAGVEGDPISLVAERQVTFWNRKRVLASTCTIKNASRIEGAYGDTDMRKFWVPCPHCSEAAGHLDGFQLLDWRRMVKDKEPPHTGTVYPCAHCGVALSEFDKPWMLAHGDWRAERPHITKKVGFWISALYSPFVSWAQLTEQFVHAVTHRENPELLKTFVNLKLAETWEEQAEVLRDDELMRRREDYPVDRLGQLVLPDGVCVVTAGVDVQADRIELLLVGWGKGEEAWFLEWKQFDGDTAKPDVWKLLDDFLLSRRYLHVRGVRLEIAATFVDSGYHANDVYLWAGPRRGRRIFASKGVSGFGKPALMKASHNNRYKIRMYPLAVDVIKEVIYSRLKLQPASVPHDGATQGAGYMHFCRSDAAGHTPEFFAQLTCEKLVRRYVRGFPVRQWEKPAGARNEALDLTVYAYAAFLSLSSNPQRLIDDLRKQLLEDARREAQQRRTHVDPNQLPLLQLSASQESVPSPPPEAVPADVRSEAGLACKAHRGAPDADCAVCQSIKAKAKQIRQVVDAVLEKHRAKEAEERGLGLGAHEYTVAEQLDKPTELVEEEEPERVRARRSSWL